MEIIDLIFPMEKHGKILEIPECISIINILENELDIDRPTIRYFPE
jgi:hypothetical protein